MQGRSDHAIPRNSPRADLCDKPEWTCSIAPSPKHDRGLRLHPAPLRRSGQVRGGGDLLTALRDGSQLAQGAQGWAAAYLAPRPWGPRPVSPTRRAVKDQAKDEC
jgi:hypothetical protein